MTTKKKIIIGILAIIFISGFNMGLPGIIGACIGLLGVYMYYMKPPVDQKTGDLIPEKRKNQNATIFIVLGLMLFAYARIQKIPAFEKENLAREAKELEKEKADSTAKAETDGSLLAYVRAERYLKESLKDPDSYEEIQELHHLVKNGDRAGQYEVFLQYRAKNSFNGYVVGSKLFYFDKNVNLIDMKDFEIPKLNKQ